MADLAPLDHRALMDVIVQEVEDVFAGPELEEVAGPMRTRIEQNRQALLAALRQAPGIINQARGAMRGGAPPEAMIHAGVNGPEPASVSMAADAAPPAVRSEIIAQLQERMELYREILGSRFDLRLMSDGEEIIDTEDCIRFPEQDRDVFATSWSAPQTAGSFPHDRIAFLAGTMLLARKWAGDGLMTTEIRTRAGTVLPPRMPVKAAMLHAVQRWPVVFVEPEFLHRRLRNITEVRADGGIPVPPKNAIAGRRGERSGSRTG